MVSNIVALVFVIGISQVYSLSVRPCAKLPIPIFATTAVYDGTSDSIFVLGGNDGEYSTRQILKFDIISTDVEVVAEFSDGVASGVAAIDKNGDIYYFGGGPAPIDGYAPSFIHKFSTKNFKVTKMANLSEHFWPGGSSAVTVGDSIYIIGGDYGYLDRSYIFRYHIPTNTFGIVKVLPISLSSTAAVYNGKHIYSFGGTHEFKASGIVLKFDPATLETKIIDASLPETKSGANALLVEDIVYVLGGRNFDFKLSKIAAVFNTTNESITETIVESPFPLPRSAGAVYVEKKNQIYIFGGHGETKPSYDVLAVVFNN